MKGVERRTMKLKQTPEQRRVRSEQAKKAATTRWSKPRPSKKTAELLRLMRGFDNVAGQRALLMEALTAPVLGPRAITMYTIARCGVCEFEVRPSNNEDKDWADLGRHVRLQHPEVYPAAELDINKWKSLLRNPNYTGRAGEKNEAIVTYRSRSRRKA